MSISRATFPQVLLALAAAGFATVAAAAPLTPVATANQKTPGVVAPNVLSPELDLRLLATGALPLDGATASTGYYGYINNGSVSTMLPVLGSAAAPAVPAAEASKTEPDKNTYLVFDPDRGAPRQLGADQSYDYGSHFLYQGHEAGDHGYLTRINLDADSAHRVTLLADTLSDGVGVVPNIDGSTWDAFAGRLLLTGEEAAFTGVGAGVVMQATVNYPARIEKLDTIIGIAGWEGVQTDNAGNIWLVAIRAGSTASSTARRANPTALSTVSFHVTAAI